jgi:TRAP-type C4-dicarboxylate transport system substrate-binding protein
MRWHAISLRCAAVVATVALAVVLPGGSPATALAQQMAVKPDVTVKMATLVPENSSWFLVLKEVASKWNKISNGRVLVLLYPSGRRGDDPDVVRDMRLGALHGAILTSVGVGEIDRSVYAVSIPMAYDDYEEVYYVLDKMRPRMEARIEAQGFIVLNWADGGWMHFFSTRPVGLPDDLKKLKMFSWAGDAKSTDVWKAAGFDPIPAPSTDLMAGLKRGTFEAFGMPPQVAVISRYYESAKFMTDMKWALLLGATVIKKDVWEKIPADLRPALMQAAREAGDKLRAEIRKSGDRDVQAMKSAGLTVVPVDAKAKETWRKLAEGVYPSLRGTFVPAEAFDEAIKYRDEYRKQKATRK